MRLFTGLELSEEVTERLERLLTVLRPTAHIKWSPSYNLHVTLKFIGEWPEGRLEELTAVLGGIRSSGPLAVAVSGLGWFPNPHSPRVFWAGIDGPEEMRTLAVRNDEVLQTLGIKPETRPFSPHLTLARIGQPTPLQPLRQAIAALESVQFGAFDADRFYLYLSKPGAAGSVYSKIAEFPLRP